MCQALADDAVTELRPVQDETLLKRKTMMPFPLTKAGPRYQTYFPHMEIIKLFCTCQMPEIHSVTHVGTGTTSSA